MSYENGTLRGFYKVENPKKYLGNVQNVVFRSSWELKFMKWCDANSNVLEWGSEELAIPYISPVDKRIHRYFVDFYMKIKDVSGQTNKYLVEIKPAKFLIPPKQPKRQTKRFINEVVTYSINQAKWKFAEEFCKDQGWKFIILTEKDLGIVA